MFLWNQLRQIEPTIFIEIFVLSCLFYYIILFFKGTRGAAILTGFVVLIIALLIVTQFFHLDTLNWFLQYFSGFMVIAFVVIFQPEIRRALAQLGRQHVFLSVKRERSLIDHLVQAITHLADRKIGALIAIERDIGMRSIQDTGTRVDSQVTPELLATIFYPHTPLHDGGVVIREDRVVAAGCFFPLSQRDELSKSLGTRHRAAIGVTEETDALVVVVSEETGAISIAYRGRLSRGLDEERLRRLLSGILIKRETEKTRMARVQEELDITPEGVAKSEELLGEEVGRDA